MKNKEIWIEWSKTSKLDYSVDEPHIISNLKTMFPNIYTSLVWLKSRPDEHQHGVIIYIPSSEDSDLYWIELFWSDGKVSISLETIGEISIGQVHIQGLDTVTLEDLKITEDALREIFGIHLRERS